MAAKRSPTLPPPPTDGAPPRRQPALEMRVRIPADLVARLDLLALHANRDRRRQAEWLLWEAIRATPSGDEAPPPALSTAAWPDPEDTP